MLKNEKNNFIEEKKAAYQLINDFGVDKILGFSVDELSLDITIKDSSIQQLTFDNYTQFSVFLNELSDQYHFEVNSTSTIVDENSDSMLNFRQNFSKKLKSKNAIIGYISLILLNIVLAIIFNLSLPVMLAVGIPLHFIFKIIDTLEEIKTNKKNFGENFQIFTKIYYQIERCRKIVECKQNIKEADEYSVSINEIQKLLQHDTTIYHEVGESELEHSRGQMTL